MMTLSDRLSYHKIGTTYGLAQRKTSVTAPEQVYVYTGPDADRPVIVHGWVGYSIPQQMELTKRQARELIGLLLDAVLEVE
jgi:hypothetical protein